MDKRLAQALKLIVEVLEEHHASNEEAEDAIRAVYRAEPSTWDSADISYDQETP